MTGSRNIEAARRYHEGTKHPGGRLLDPYHRYTGQRPHLFKEYEGGERVALPVDKSPGEVSALQAIALDGEAGDAVAVPDLQALARLLYFSAGITKRIDRGPRVGKIPFRAAACTGALYHIELYVVCGELPGLAAGVYHFDPQEPALLRLRQGDLRDVLARAAGEAPSVARAPLTLVYSDVYWRNAIKYQAREYRHAFWDSGTILSHSLALAAAQGLPAQVILGFADQPVNKLLGLDTEEEFALALLPVGRTETAPPPALDPLPPLQATPATKWPRHIAAILEMHRASSLADGESAAAWRQQAREAAVPDDDAPEVDALVPLPHMEDADMAQDALETVIQRRGSSRRFTRQPLALRQLSVMLRQSMRGLAADFASLQGPALNQVYLIASGVDGLAPGAYRFHSAQHALQPLAEGSEQAVRRAAGHLALGQELGADAAANIYFLSDLHGVLARLGNRGYRAAQLEASIMAGRIYLAAYAQDLGATGLTFYDDEVTAYFGQPGKAVMFLVAVGE